MDNVVDGQNLEETVKKFDATMKQMEDEVKEAYSDLKQSQESVAYDDTLIEKIIHNSIMITKSPQMVEVITKLKSKIDEEELAAILNLVIYTSSAAAHQAIIFYDEVLRQKLLVDFNKVEEFVNNNAVDNMVAIEQIKILNKRLNEVREKLQIDDIVK